MISYCCNSAVKKAKGDFFLFLDHDDEIVPKALETFSNNWDGISEENKINLDIHNKCTLECNKCARFSILSRPDITTSNFPGCPLTDSDWKKILDHYTRINFCGQVADPMMHPKLSNFLGDMYAENKVGNVHTAVSHKPMKYFLKEHGLFRS